MPIELPGIPQWDDVKPVPPIKNDPPFEVVKPGGGKVVQLAKLSKLGGWLRAAGVIALFVLCVFVGFNDWQRVPTPQFQPRDQEAHATGVPRSPHWPATEKAFKAKHPTCEACGETRNLQVHHVLPYHKYPELELDESNLITLCEYPPHNCHFRAHLYDWKSWDKDIRKHAAETLQAIKERPR